MDGATSSEGFLVASGCRRRVEAARRHQVLTVMTKQTFPLQNRSRRMHASGDSLHYQGPTQDFPLGRARPALELLGEEVEVEPPYLTGATQVWQFSTHSGSPQPLPPQLTADVNHFVIVIIIYWISGPTCTVHENDDSFSRSKILRERGTTQFHRGIEEGPLPTQRTRMS